MAILRRYVLLADRSWCGTASGAEGLPPRTQAVMECAGLIRFFVVLSLTSAQGMIASQARLPMIVSIKGSHSRFVPPHPCFPPLGLPEFILHSSLTAVFLHSPGDRSSSPWRLLALEVTPLTGWKDDGTRGRARAPRGEAPNLRILVPGPAAQPHWTPS